MGVKRSTSSRNAQRRLVSERLTKSTRKSKLPLLTAEQKFNRLILNKFSFSKISSDMQLKQVIDFVISNVKLVNSSETVAKNAYGKITPIKAMLNGAIPVLYADAVPAHGCGMMVDTLGAVLKKFDGISNVKHVRTISQAGYPHSVLYFELKYLDRGNLCVKKFVADPFVYGSLFFGGTNHRPITYLQVGESLGRKIGVLKKLGFWKEGENLSDFNKTYSHYMQERKLTQNRIHNSPQLRELLLNYFRN
ncbi:MAG: hypothetical protein PHQ98_03660 [Candidatus ainarchaeum sp.]|nr:hypothetical protein [Candidatus ainarchaeum sp.]